MTKKSKAIIVDLDGTLANIKIRLQYLTGKKDWNGFNSSISEIKYFEHICMCSFDGDLVKHFTTLET
jgi:histidinol phosphatase-like enzyme